jgi:hypothetical protein
MDTKNRVRTVVVHKRKIDINLTMIFADSKHQYAVLHLDPEKSYGYKCCHSYPEACALIENYNKRLNCLLMIDIDGNPLHYASDKKTLPVELQ